MPSPSAILTKARADSGLTVREIARRAGTSHSTLLAYEAGRKVPSVETFLRILDACGFVVNFDLERRIRVADGIQRGDELEAVLALAEQFPVKVSREMDFPILGQSL